MTKKELEELVKKQAEQISELISLVQKKEKEIVIVKESETKPWVPSPVSPWPSPVFPSPWSPTSPISPWVTYCGTGTGKCTSSSSTEPKNKNTFYSNEPLCVMDSCLGNEVTASGSSLPNEKWDKEPEMIKAWDKLGIIGHNKSEGMV